MWIATHSYCMTHFTFDTVLTYQNLLYNVCLGTTSSPKNLWACVNLINGKKKLPIKVENKRKFTEGIVLFLKENEADILKIINEGKRIRIPSIKTLISASSDTDESVRITATPIRSSKYQLNDEWLAAEFNSIRNEYTSQTPQNECYNPNCRSKIIAVEEENENLKEENANLKEENANLKKEIADCKEKMERMKNKMIDHMLGETGEEVENNNVGTKKVGCVGTATGQMA
ncbi:uncharacterized protein LOC123301403 [Chrysoperla carnea]|uniref:uncharacterized protein LOC123301403 n=1 Tax=Chrysoperla carnea TaxID=189513 RepID=UPI001D0727B6|nr:uncharacterized protein LOC123301403 [Chrysoperla carnea]